jgi:hypothetical protein
MIADSMHFTPEGRRLLWSLQLLEPDPLRVAAEVWLSEHEGCKTPATRRVRAALGPPVPAEWLAIAAAMRGVK